jgi:uncharacterized protein (DUF433 family)
MMRDVSGLIVPDPSRSGKAEYVLAGTRTHVWAIIGYWHAVKGDIDEVARDYEVPREMIEAAIAYYGQHRAIIDARIEANSE